MNRSGPRHDHRPRRVAPALAELAKQSEVAQANMAKIFGQVHAAQNLRAGPAAAAVFTVADPHPQLPEWDTSNEEDRNSD